MESTMPWASPDAVQASVWLMAPTGSLPLTCEPSLTPNSETNSTSTSIKVLFFGKHKVERPRKWDHCHQENFGGVQYSRHTILLTPPSAIMGISWERQQSSRGHSGRFSWRGSLGALRSRRHRVTQLPRLSI